MQTSSLGVKVTGYVSDPVSDLVRIPCFLSEL